MQRQPHRPALSWLNAHVAPDAASVARLAPDHFRRYVARDYRHRARGRTLRWSDVQPAYLLALQCHLSCWPQDCEGWNDQLAIHWESCRGESRLEWPQARDVVTASLKVLGPLSGQALQ